MKILRNLKKLEAEARKAHSGVADDTWLTAKAVFYLIYQHEREIKLLEKIAHQHRYRAYKKWWEFWR